MLSGEEDHQLAKQSTGLDAGQVIRWKSWHRWTTLCLLACIYLAVAVTVHRWPGRPGGATTSTAPAKLTDAGTPMPR